MAENNVGQVAPRSYATGGRRAATGQYRATIAAPWSDWLAERFRRHRGNADVVRQDLVREKGIVVSLRTVERAVAPLRQAFEAEARATVRFETPPGRQLQIDFGETRVAIGGENVRLHLFGATLGYSRRCFGVQRQRPRPAKSPRWRWGIRSAIGRRKLTGVVTCWRSGGS